MPLNRPVTTRDLPPTSAPVHRFAVGQLVRLRVRYGMPATVSDVFSITATLPERENSPQYRIRNEEERYERVTTEASLEEIEPADTVAAIA